MTTDFTEKNRQAFDKKAATYKSGFEKVVETLVNVVQEQRSWVSDTWVDTEAGKGKEIKALEYACGPGYISLALAPFVNRVVGMDISDNMLEEFKKHVREAGRSETMIGVKADLVSESSPAEVSGPEYFNFDLVFVSMALHHFEFPEKAMINLGKRLKKGGVMMIIDMIPEDHHGHEHEHARHQMGDMVDTISKHGFSLEEMRTMYENAGVGIGFEYKVLESPLVFTKDGKTFEKTIFIARGQK
ncbi:class I SAM-dependent methyltransferase [Aspergillus mulundensis]|uniref:SAM-dependent methyltransferase n=1 Tax=Aspergillus mulundensis TaxID=1810919 RepID=A0A3D8T7S5_9EURO|nr:SAM-dependent methyltransferase [Aspergillus mulundensis]RDW94048.1 SAM-dependent methyltransferase [Aspergillus mulundensis]